MEVAVASGIRRLTLSTMVGEPDVQKGAPELGFVFVDYLSISAE